MDSLCANKIPMESFHCYWHTNNDPFLIFGPIKAEILSISPKIVRFHEVYSDKEIEKLKEISLGEYFVTNIILSPNDVTKVIFTSDNLKTSKTTKSQGQVSNY